MIKIEIIAGDDGRITVNGPLQNKLICWGLLTAASDVIRTYDPSKKLIEVPDFVPPPDIRSDH